MLRNPHYWLRSVEGVMRKLDTVLCGWVQFNQLNQVYETLRYKQIINEILRYMRDDNLNGIGECDC